VEPLIRSGHTHDNALSCRERGAGPELLGVRLRDRRECIAEVTPARRSVETPSSGNVLEPKGRPCSFQKACGSPAHWLEQGLWVVRGRNRLQEAGGCQQILVLEQCHGGSNGLRRSEQPQASKCLKLQIVRCYCYPTQAVALRIWRRRPQDDAARTAMFEARVQEGYEQLNECVPSPLVELAAARQVQVCAGEDGREARSASGYGPNYFCQSRCPSVCGQRSQHELRRVSRGDRTSMWNVRNAGINVQAAFVAVAKQRPPGRAHLPPVVRGANVAAARRRVQADRFSADSARGAGAASVPGAW
jgi:hypothetical protein